MNWARVVMAPSNSGVAPEIDAIAVEAAGPPECRSFIRCRPMFADAGRGDPHCNCRLLRYNRPQPAQSQVFGGGESIRSEHLSIHQVFEAASSLHGIPFHIHSQCFWLKY